MNLFQQMVLAQADASRTYYEVMRLRQLDEWWHWLLLVLGCLVVLFAVSTMYFLDSRQLARGKRWLLLLLRVLAFVGLLIFLMDLQKRTEQKLVRNSRFAVVVDASQSMGIVDMPLADSSKESRIAAVVRAFSQTGFLADLRKKHDVTVYRFDETNLPSEVATFAQTGSVAGDVDTVDEELLRSAALSEVRSFWKIAAGMFGLAAVALLLNLVLGSLVRTAEGESWALLVSVFALVVGVVLVAVANLRQPEYGPRQAFGWVTATEDAAADSDADNPADSAQDGERQPEPGEIEWARLLEPAGGSTRMGDAITWVLARERGAPLAGIALITDGNSNRGVEPLAATVVAGENEVPLYPIGIASDLPPSNVRLVDLEAPARVYPGDEFKLTGYIQAYGLAGQSVDVTLVSSPEQNPDGQQVLEADLTIPLGVDGEVLPIPMQVTPEEVGKRIYTLQISSNIDRDKSDNMIQAKVQIVDRKSRVLLLAGGPTREYRFVRNMLHRDKDVSVDVLLQTAVEGVSQEADDILFDLPLEAAGLFDYDAIVAFDPDWTQFDQTQLELLERWVAEKAGGLVCIAGAVNTAVWAEDRRAPSQISIVRQLYPVTFSSSRIQLGRYGASISWPLEITEDGRTVPFLDLADEEGEAEDIWNSFPGVYGYYPVRDVKPAAMVYARFSDPQVALNEQQPPLIVGQFYGSGKVVFMGTGELWRLRSIDEGHFERFYTKLIRFVSEGRLLRDSNRGLLLVDKDRALRGDAISVRASVVDEQFQPLRDPSIRATLKLPNGSTEVMELQQTDGGRDGMYGGRFIATQAGDYQVQLVLPGDGEPVVLEREVRVRLPNLEIERPQRNDPLLQEIATTSGGQYFVGLASAIEGQSSLAATVISKRRETFLPGTPDRDFQQRLMTWLLVLICGTLFLEWTIRRLSKLA